MPYDESLARRVRAHLADQSDLHERKMFGGLTYMVRGNMCCGIVGDELMVRPSVRQAAALAPQLSHRAQLLRVPDYADGAHTVLTYLYS